MTDNHASEPVTEVSDLFYSSSEPEPLKPTDEEVSTSPAEDETIEDSEADAETADDAETDDSETDSEESEEGDNDSDDDEDAVYLDLDGEEHNLDDVRDWKKSHDSGKSMQVDYTKKTMALAEDRKSFDVERTAFDEVKSKVNDLSVELEAMVAEDEDIDWAELRELDPDDYIAKKEQADKRKAKVAELKAEAPKQNTLTQGQLVEQRKTLFDANPSWLKDGKETDDYKTDISRAYDYAVKIGYSAEELQNISQAHHWITLLDASKDTKATKKKTALEKKVKKAPLVTKPRKKQVKKTRSAEDVFYGS